MSRCTTPVTVQSVKKKGPKSFDVGRVQKTMNLGCGVEYFLKISQNSSFIKL
jgi:hypothetical protein